MEIFLAKSQGFCAGVATAVEIVERALEKYGAPLYVFHEIVHNSYVVEDFRQRGVVFVDKIDEVPEGMRIIFSAHGIPPPIFQVAQQRNLICVDATCPLVKKVHRKAMKFSENNCHIILIGHRKHQEMVGTSGYITPQFLHIIGNVADIEGLDIDSQASVGYLTQTTLSLDETMEIIGKLRARFPKLKGPEQADICYATQKRQDAIKDLAKVVDSIIVCGSPNSSNSNRLRETGEHLGVTSYIIDKAEELDIGWLEGKSKIGISSGASVPQVIVDELIKKIQKHYPDCKIHGTINQEDAHLFPIPEI